jgi:putative endonuclease
MLIMECNFYFVYILSNERNTVLYIGITNNLNRRVWEHKNNFYKRSFTSRYNVYKLVYFEIFEDPTVAINRETILKTWNREWKFNLIRRSNPKFRDIGDKFIGF